MAIHVKLSTILGEKRWSQADLVRATDIRPTTIGELYHDIALRINLDHLDKICEALGCDIYDILKRAPGEEQRVKTKAGKPKKKQKPDGYDKPAGSSKK